MNKIFMAIALISVIFLVGCSTNSNNEVDVDTNVTINESGNENDKINNEEMLPEDLSVEINKSFEERTVAFLEKVQEIEGDREKKDFTNIRLSKVNDYYKLEADLLGDMKLDREVLENAIKEINEKSLGNIEVETIGGTKVLIYSSRPESIKEMYNNYEKEGDEFIGIPAYDDDDWVSSKSDEEWLDERGLPMYIRAENCYDWAILNSRIEDKDTDGYYLYERVLAGRDSNVTCKDINEKEAITLLLLPQDKIVLDKFDFYGDDIDFVPTVITVEEYYRIATTSEKVLDEASIDKTMIVKDENGNIFNIDSMSYANYNGAGLDIKDGEIHVYSQYDGP